MKNVKSSCIVLLLLLCSFSVCLAQEGTAVPASTTTIPETVLVPRAEEIYTCGNYYEIASMNEPVISNVVTRKLTTGTTNYESVIRPAKGKLFTIRVRVRSTQHETVRLQPESFKLTGYMYGKAKTYTPAAIQETDYRFMNLRDYSNAIQLGKINSSYAWYLSLIQNQRADISDLYVNPDVQYFFFNEEMPANIRPTRFVVSDMLPLRVWDLNVIFDVSTDLENWEFSFEPVSGMPAEDGTVPEASTLTAPCKLTLKFPSVWDSTGVEGVRIYPK